MGPGQNRAENVGVAFLCIFISWICSHTRRGRRPGATPARPPSALLRRRDPRTSTRRVIGLLRTAIGLSAISASRLISNLYARGRAAARGRGSDWSRRSSNFRENIRPSPGTADVSARRRVNEFRTTAISAAIGDFPGNGGRIKNDIRTLDQLRFKFSIIPRSSRAFKDVRCRSQCSC